MPVSIDIHETTGVVVMTLIGELRPEEIRIALEQLESDPRSSAEYNFLVDARPMSGAFSGRAVRDLALAPGPVVATSRRAVLVETDYGFGMSRMFNLRLGEDKLAFTIFRDEAEARRYVGLEPEIPVEESDSA